MNHKHTRCECRHEHRQEDTQTENQFDSSALLKALRHGIPIPLVSYTGQKVTARRAARDAVTGDMMILYTKGEDPLWLSRSEETFFCYVIDTVKDSPTFGQCVPYYSIDCQEPTA